MVARSCTGRATILRYRDGSSRKEHTADSGFPDQPAVLADPRHRTGASRAAGDDSRRRQPDDSCHPRSFCHPEPGPCARSHACRGDHLARQHHGLGPCHPAGVRHRSYAGYLPGGASTRSKGRSGPSPGGRLCRVYHRRSGRRYRPRPAAPCHQAVHHPLLVPRNHGDGPVRHPHDLGTLTRRPPARACRCNARAGTGHDRAELVLSSATVHLRHPLPELGPADHPGGPWPLRAP